MITFSDLLYGRIELPRWIGPFLRIPEFVRLRNVRLSNVDSIEFKDFGSARRWEHGIAVAYLAWRCGEFRGLKMSQRAELTLAGLLHDIATPPFAHTAEAVLDGYDHEFETQRVLSALPTESSYPDMPVYGSSLPQFRRAVRALAREEGISIDADEVARMVVGDGELGFLISGTIDLDNVDNVTRGCAHMGFKVDPLVPLQIVRWLSEHSGAPTDLEKETNPAVQAWLEYRKRYYTAFFSSSDQEHGRQALLQHLMRRALGAGLPRRALVWSTDEELLNRISQLEEHTTIRERISLPDLVEQYRLIDPTHRIFSVDIDDEDEFRVLRQPSATTWVEEQLSGPNLEVLLLMSARRFGETRSDLLFSRPVLGTLQAFKTGGELQHHHLPVWLKRRVPHHSSGGELRQGLAQAVHDELINWYQSRPWLSFTAKRRESVVDSLQSVGDWSFRLSRNENLHPYPSTFVHAIPASLINALGLRGEMILDTFGGTGQTAGEAIKYDCSAISADSNTIATLIARARLTYLSPTQREVIRNITLDQLCDSRPSEAPEFDRIESWHHPKTLDDLCRIAGFISSVSDAAVRDFLLVSFSAIIPLTTARKGKEHGFFADNTPLPAGLEMPPYADAGTLFLARLEKNLGILERYYGFIERTGRSAEKELVRARVCKLDASKSAAEDYGVPLHSVGGIITSPPYLCMADYTLGQRLSYYWIAPGSFCKDFEAEIAARRHRFSSERALKSYFESLEHFAINATRLLKPGGFLATVLGTPVAQVFKDENILERVDEILAQAGFEPIWAIKRPIHWHRNQGYQRLRHERVAVHVKK